MVTTPETETPALNAGTDDIGAGSLPVIALGGGVTLAAVLRILHRAGIPTYTVCDQADVVTRSRWYRKLPLSGPESCPETLATLLEHTPVERAVLMACSDDWVRAVAMLPSFLRSRFPSSAAPLEAIDVLTDKWKFAMALEKLNLPRPRTRLIRSHDELETGNWRPSILKPLCSVDFSRKTGVKGFLVETPAAALAAMEHIEFPIMLQEFIPGPANSGYFLDGFVDRNGQVCAMTARRRLRMYPPGLGNSTLMQSIALHEVGEAAVALRSLLQALHYRGVFSAEFKYDQRDGLFKMIEVNARPWWYVGFAERCGVDVCSMAYRDAMNLAVAPLAGYEVGRRYVFGMSDLLAWRQQRKGGQSLWTWLRSWVGADDALFHWNDPAPAVAYARTLLGKKLSAPSRMTAEARNSAETGAPLTKAAASASPK